MADVAELIEVMLDEHNPVEIRIHAIAELGELEDNKAVAPLIQLLTHYEEKILCASAEALGHIGDMTAIPALQKLLYESKTRAVCEYTASAITEIADWEIAVAVLIDTLDSTSVESRMAVISELSEGHGEDVTNAIVRMTQDPVLEVRREAIWSLGYMHETEAIPALIEAAHKKENQAIYETILFSFGEIRDERGFPYIAEALKNPNPNVRSSAVYAINRLRNKKFVPYLEKMIKVETDEKIRKEAETFLEALLRFGR